MRGWTFDYLDVGTGKNNTASLTCGAAFTYKRIDSCDSAWAGIAVVANALPGNNGGTYATYTVQ